MTPHETIICRNLCAALPGLDPNPFHGSRTITLSYEGEQVELTSREHGYDISVPSHLDELLPVLTARMITIEIDVDHCPGHDGPAEMLFTAGPSKADVSRKRTIMPFRAVFLPRNVPEIY